MAASDKPADKPAASKLTEVSAIALDGGMDNEAQVPSEISILPNANYVLYPSMIAPLVVQGESNLKMVDEAMKGDRIIGLFAVRPDVEKTDDSAPTGFDQIFDVGTAAAILKMLKVPDGSVRLLVHGSRRVRITGRLATEPYLRAAIEPLVVTTPDDTETKAMMKGALTLLKTFVQNSSLAEDVLVAATNMEDPGKLADLLASNVSIPIPEQQSILEIEDAKKRLYRVQEILTRELEIVSLGKEIQSQIKSNMDKHQRDFFLREQMKVIRKELGEEKEGRSELGELKAKIKKKRLPERVNEIAMNELARLEDIPMASPEYTVVRTYLGWILDLPWSEHTKDNINLKRAEKILNEDHYDLEKVKERIIEFLAVIKLRKTIKGPILCLIGPPGVGKTSLGRSVARAMGRKFARLSLGGMHDEAEIRGHRRTYIGAMPGRVLKALKECGTVNPVIMLDEIDKVGSDFRGDPSSALLEVLDPEQNNSFSDNYLDIPFDLSKVLFITTGNILDTIPGPLLDRMEVVRLSGYTIHEKVKIARQYLIPRAFENTGIPAKSVRFTDDGLETIIERYTREAGLRNFERELTNICRKVARKIAEGHKQALLVDTKQVEKLLGPFRNTAEDTKRADVPGVSIGLAWTPAGGDILFIEATATPGDGRLILTGQLGEVMKESAQAALTYLRSESVEFGIAAKLFHKKNFHIHVPAGATPKDGPSAGVALMLALASLLLDRRVKPGLAMTGEITLKGNVLPVGGIKEKVLAAHRSQIRELIIPKENERDLIDVPDDVRKALKFHFVERASEAMAVAFPANSKTKSVDRPIPLRRPVRGRHQRVAARNGRNRNS